MKEPEFSFYQNRANRAEGILTDLVRLKVLMEEAEKQLEEMKRTYQKSGDTVVSDEGRTLSQGIQNFKEEIQKLQAEYEDSVKAGQAVKKGLEEFEGPKN